jgi:DNA-binding XRE family transcriptional regulator
MEDANIIERYTKKYNFNHQQLAEAIGYKKQTISQASSSGKVSEQLKRALEMYDELQEYRKHDELRKLLLNFLKIDKI